MAAKALPCPTVLRLLLRYEPETGKLFWKPRTGAWFKGRDRESYASRWNKKYAGRAALDARHGNGYKSGALFKRTAFAHRVAWAIYYGAHPNGLIDHINGNGEDNSISNLRVADCRQNSLNRKPDRGAQSRYRGVSRIRGKWRARISPKKGAPVHLGLFDTEQEAAVAYNEAAIFYYGEWARLNVVI